MGWLGLLLNSASFLDWLSLLLNKVGFLDWHSLFFNTVGFMDLLSWLLNTAGFMKQSVSNPLGFLDWLSLFLNTVFMGWFSLHWFEHSGFHYGLSVYFWTQRVFWTDSVYFGTPCNITLRWPSLLLNTKDRSFRWLTVCVFEYFFFSFFFFFLGGGGGERNCLRLLLSSGNCMFYGQTQFICQTQWNVFFV